MACISGITPYNALLSPSVSMRRTSFAIAASLLTLSACATGPGDLTLEQRLRNPLFAEYYYDDLVERMVQLQISNDPVLENERNKAAVDDIRRNGVKKAQEAKTTQNNGKSGMFIPAKEFSQGEALLVDGVLYFDPQFITTPGVETRVYLTGALDPRDEESFPDNTARDLGELKSPYGDQWYAADGIDPADVRSVVIWDERLERLMGFAQMHSQ